MNDCIVLKTANLVYNDKLQKLGCYRLSVKAGTSKISLISSAGETCYLSLVSGHVTSLKRVASGDTELSFPVELFDVTKSGSLLTIVADTECVLEVSNKYALQSIDISNTIGQVNDLSPLIRYANNLNSVKIIATTVNITTLTCETKDFIGKNSLSTINFEGVNLSGNTDAFSELSNLRTFTSKYANYLFGNVTNFAKNKNLTTLNLDRTGVSGEMTNLLDALYANGKTSGTLTFNINRTNSTYKGLPTSDNVTVTFSSTGWQ